MSSQADRWASYISASICIALIVGAISLLIVAVTNSGAILSGSALVVFQALFAGTAVACGYYLVNRLRAEVNGKIGDIYRRYDAELSRLRRGQPAYVAGLLILSQAIITIADNSFQGEPVPTIAASVALAAILGVGNSLIQQESRLKATLGWTIWFLGVGALPLAVCTYYGWDVPALIGALLSLNPLTLVLLVLLFLAVPILPALARWATETA